MPAERKRRAFLPSAALVSLLAIRFSEEIARTALSSAFAQDAGSAHKPWIGNCPRFGFSFHASSHSSSSLLETPFVVDSVAACAARCHGFVLSSFFSSTLCRGFEFDRRSRLCSLFASLPSPFASLSRPSPFIASGVSPTKTAGSLCATSCLVSEWSAWGACEGEGRTEPGAYESTSGIQRRTRHIRRLPLWGNETCPLLEELRPCTRGDSPQCAMEGIGILGWGCNPEDDFAESGTDRHFVTSFEACGNLCASDPDCTFFSLDRRPRASASFSPGASPRSEERQDPFPSGERETHDGQEVSMLCYIIHGPEPGCMFLSEHFVSAPRQGGASRCPFDCVPGEWSDWAPCSHPCSPEQQQSRTRGVKIPARNGGRDCQLVDTRNCLGSPMYPRVNCAQAECTYSPWSSWSPCSSPCEGGTQERVRSVLTGGSRPCNAVKMVRACNDGIACSSRGQDCEFSAWEEWSACKAVPGAGCGQRSGRRQRHRGILKQKKDPFSGRPLPCGDNQAFVQVEDCVAPGTDACADACVMTPWTNWSACSATCGEGWRTRVRSILRPLLSGSGKEGCPPTVETEPCSKTELAPCPPEEQSEENGLFSWKTPQCEMGEWQPWTACNDNCQRFRFRLPLSAAGRPACSVEIQEEPCDASTCVAAARAASSWSGAGRQAAASQAGSDFLPSENFSGARDSFSPFGSAPVVLPASQADVSAITRACLLSILLTLLIIFLFIYFRKKGIRGRRYIYPLDGGWTAASSFAGDNDETTSFVMTQGQENSAEGSQAATAGAERSQEGEDEVESNASEKLAKVDVDQDMSFWDDDDEETKEDK
ncbi:putative thrombospondin type 1 domain-containing protein [Neospora caninum Liverpool]|uniref:Putative thrombospondin type 1 domain-containing protein n=1 Tax=Neospora caninum (strain Liverpool) TaxID=572307 RepID=F0V821_NEOCL|nr:putative thrombospondin type 1 domain-containing protein [Neospora caninum Liverpool]CBZ49862.1 putative thrombospondin type 1 domain-containing protein [Neospora caninum Liverpool]|eukprot:XP_003879897.1 putative thrombospondin type 1 domain-containing protein [Neospora caninum Liverpool]